jgi:hypothetical protein
VSAALFSLITKIFVLHDLHIFTINTDRKEFFLPHLRFLFQCDITLRISLSQKQIASCIVVYCVGQFHWWRQPDYLENTTVRSLTIFITYSWIEYILSQLNWVHLVMSGNEITILAEFLKFIGPRGQKIMRSANNVGHFWMMCLLF